MYTDYLSVKYQSIFHPRGATAVYMSFVYVYECAYMCVYIDTKRSRLFKQNTIAFVVLERRKL